MKPSVLRKNLAVVASLAAVYFVIGKLGLMFSLMRPSITPVWPPSGIAVAGLLVLGYRVWPSVFLGALAVELTVPCSLGTAFGVAFGNTLESLVGAWLATRFARGRSFFERPWDVLKFAVLVGAVSPLISPPLGVRALTLDRFIFWGAGGDTWLIWWLGDMASLVVLTPLLVVWAVEPRWRWNRWKTLEFGLLVLLLLAVSEVVFGDWAPASARDYLLSYLCLPFLFWAAFRFGERETLTATFVLGVVVMWGTLQGYGLFGRVAPGKALLVYQGFMATTSILAMVLAAVVGQRRRAGEELLEQSRYARGLIEASLDPLVTISPEGKIADVNRATESITGVGRDQLVGSDFSEYFTEPEKAKEVYRKVVRDGQVRGFPLAVRHKSGRTSDVLYNATVRRNESGEPQGMLAIARDITERKRTEAELERHREHLEELVRQRTGQLEKVNAELQKEIVERKGAEEALRESEYRYARAQKAANIGSWDWNIQTGQLHWSEQIAPMFGFGRGQFDGTYEAFLNRVHPEDRPLVTDSVNAALQGSKDYAIEHRILWPDGTVRWVSEAGEVQRDPHGTPIRMLGIVRDVTNRKRMEEALRVNLAKYSVLFESFPLGISVTDDKGAILEANQAAVRLLGLPIEEHTRRRVDSVEWQIIRPDRTPMPAEEYASVRVLKERRRVENQEMGIVRGDNQVTWISVTAEPLPLEGYGVVITYSDITGRKRTEEAVQRSEATLRGILDAAKEPIWLFSPDGRILIGNATAVERFGNVAGDVVGKHFSESMPAELARERLTRLREVVESGRPLECEDERSNIYFHHSFYPVLDAAGRVNSVACFSRDITGLRRAEQALQRANADLEQRVAERTETLRQTNRILRMISECNEALVHGTNEQALIQRICRTIHEIGGFRMVWAGWAENDRFKTVRPVAVVGFEAGYFQKARITWADNKYGRGPTGRAIRTGRICTANDFLSDPELAPWRKLALERGFRSSVALPLLTEGRAFGALTIYAAEPAAFDQKQIELLSELADDLSFGITSLRVQAERDRVRKELERNTVQLRQLTAELSQAEERERRRVASVLHDSIQQLLVGARYGVETLRGHSRAEAFQQTIQHVDGLLGRCLEASRSLTLELSPPILYEAGLAPALKWLGRWFHETHGLMVSVVAEDQALSDTEEIRAAVFHAVRELLFNVVKHAKVRRAQVHMSRVGESGIKILVADKGAGFEPTKPQAREGKACGFGLFSLRERLASLGGHMEVESAPGRGSRFTLIVPLGGSHAELAPGLAQTA